MEHRQGIGKYEPNREAIGRGDSQNIEKNGVETWGSTMYENNFPQIANENELKERPEGDKSTKQSIRCQGGPSESSGQQAAEAREQKPGEKNQRDGDFITVKLGEELPNGD